MQKSKVEEQEIRSVAQATKEDFILLDDDVHSAVGYAMTGWKKPKSKLRRYIEGAAEAFALLVLLGVLMFWVTVLAPPN